jgi:hypothetical protein
VCGKRAVGRVDYGPGRVWRVSPNEQTGVKVAGLRWRECGHAVHGDALAGCPSRLAHVPVARIVPAGGRLRHR